MYILTTLEDTIQLPPTSFHRLSRIALEDAVNARFANKVVPQIGLVICFWDLLSASDGMIRGDDADVHVRAKFRLLVFRPFRGEIIEGVIGESSTQSIQVHLEFFHDIVIPAPEGLPEPARFDPQERVWIWTHEGQDFYFDQGTRICFRVDEEIWGDEPSTSPDPAMRSEFEKSLADLQRQIKEAAFERGENADDLIKGNMETGMPQGPWRLYGSMKQPGLGPIEWWDED